MKVDVLTVALITSSLMLVVALITYLLYLSVKKVGSSSGSSSEPYLCGEGVEDFRSSISVGSTNLFWGSTSVNLRGFYSVVRNRIHTGVLNDWFFYMGIWLVLGVSLNFIVIVLGGR